MGTTHSPTTEHGERSSSPEDVKPPFSDLVGKATLGLPARSNDDEDTPASAPAVPSGKPTVVTGAVLVPGDLPALPCMRCFRSAVAGAGALASPACTFAPGSVRCHLRTCQAKGNCRPIPALMAGDVYVFMVIVEAVLSRPALAGDQQLEEGLRAHGVHLVRLIDGHRKSFGLTGSHPSRANEVAYAQSVMAARAVVAPATAGRDYLMRLWPGDGGAAAVAAVLGAARDLVLARAVALGEDVAAVEATMI